MRHVARFLGWAVAAGTFLGGARARACRSPTGCEGSGVYPIGEAMPSSAAALEWAYPLHMLPTTGVRLERVDVATEAWVDVPVDVTAGGIGVATIRPRDGFLADTRYRITTPGSECPARVSGAAQAFRTAGPAPLPTTLGALTATAPAQANVQQRMFVGGSCGYQASAMTSLVSVALSAEAAPWSSMLSYEVRVDGEPFVGLVQWGYPVVSPPLGGTHAGRGLAYLAVICGPSTDPYTAGDPVSPGDGLAEGEHEVVFRARVVGTTTVVETAPVRVTLRCPPTAAADAGGAPVDAGTVAVDGSRAPEDAGAAAADVGSGPVDASVAAVDAPGDAGSPAADAGGGSTSTGGCSVTTTPAGGIAALWTLAGALTLLARRRRRAR